MKPSDATPEPPKQLAACTSDVKLLKYAPLTPAMHAMHARHAMHAVHAAHAMSALHAMPAVHAMPVMPAGACDALVLLGRRWQPIVDEKAYRTIIAGTFKPLFQPKNDYKENVVSYL